MVPLSLDQVRRFVDGRLEWVAGPGGSASSVLRVMTDSRQIRPGDLFVALSGARHDGHAFVADARGRGAVGAVVQTDWTGARALGPGDPFALIQVPETLRAYGQLGLGYRRTRPIQVVAITGSNGKTTTKEFLAAILAMRYRVRKSPASYNNEVGVPATLLAVEATDEVVVVEMGARHPGDLGNVSEIAQPTAGVVTNIGRAHLETFGSVDSVMRAKRELVEGLDTSAVAVLPWDDPHYASLRTAARCYSVSFGFEAGAEVRGRELALAPDARPSFAFGAARLTLRTPGVHNARNALAALAVGAAFGVPLAGMRAALEAVQPVVMRLEERQIGALRLLVDCYNANPDSTVAALDVLAATALAEGARRLALLGEMHELGAGAAAAHEDLGRRAAEADVAELITVGAWAEAVARGAMAAGLPPRPDPRLRFQSGGSSAPDDLGAAGGSNPGQGVARRPPGGCRKHLGQSHRWRGSGRGSVGRPSLRGRHILTFRPLEVS